jgi:D-alanyl-lipoteichoic acid acyltransferase DltB (MBOAT superfamily)
VFFASLFAIVNYFFGLGIEYFSGSSKRKKLFWFAIITNVGILSFYKFLNPIFESYNYLISWIPTSSLIHNFSIVIPIGISYYTFQAIGYLIRINRGSEKAERNIGKFATYLLFFPKFLAGPVERSNHFLPQIHSEIKFDESTVNAGMRLFLLGLFKKVVIANNLSGPVAAVYNNLSDYSGFPLILVLFLQTIFLYTDFTGYTDMALGSAKMLGINIIDNFKRPFLAKSVTEFWHRWHISLSSWCNDFIFVPLIVKYRKIGNIVAYSGIFLIFFIIGIWHGASWTFVVLGLLQAVAISYEFYTKKKRLQLISKLPKNLVHIIGIITTFTFFSFSLVFFNSKSLTDSWYFVTHMFSIANSSITHLNMVSDKPGFIFGIVAFAIIFAFEIMEERGINTQKIFMQQPRYLRWMIYYVTVLLVYIFSASKEAFVYLQF